MMMLPATSMRDIFMHNVMSPFMNFFVGRRTKTSTSRKDENEVETEDDTPSKWSAFKNPGKQLSNRTRRKNWWRSLGQIHQSKEDQKEKPNVISVPDDASHIAKSRRKRTIGLYSYAPWLTNDVIHAFQT